MLEAAPFVTSLFFLVGIVIMIVGSFPKVRDRSPRLFLNGFLLTIVGIAMMLAAAFWLSPPN